LIVEKTNSGGYMNSKLSMTLAGFGVVFLGFGFTILVLGMLSLHYGARESLGHAATIGGGMAVVGAILFGAGFSLNKKNPE
jgi:hypothetical protein